MTTEADWLAFLARRDMPPLALRPSARLVVVAPHPDDEVLACGGLIAEHLAAGGELRVVAVTDGDASHPGDPAWPADRLTAERRKESAEGLVRLDATRAGDVSTIRLGLPDGAVGAHVDGLAYALHDHIRPADRVVTTWRQDGHPDHEATGAAVARVALARGAELLEAPVWMWHHRQPDDPEVSGAAWRVLALGEHARAAKSAALRAHRTQWTPRIGGEGPVLDPEILARARWAVEYFWAADPTRHP